MSGFLFFFSPSLRGLIDELFLFPLMPSLRISHLYVIDCFWPWSSPPPSFLFFSLFPPTQLLCFFFFPFLFFFPCKKHRSKHENLLMLQGWLSGRGFSLFPPSFGRDHRGPPPSFFFFFFFFFKAQDSGAGNRSKASSLFFSLPPQDLIMGLGPTLFLPFFFQTILGYAPAQMIFMARSNFIHFPPPFSLFSSSNWRAGGGLFSFPLFSRLRP